MRSIKIILVLLAINFTSANAQKLPKVQEASLRAPDNIKIDGKPTEWNNQFQAYNRSVDLFYTIANDNKNLYLVVQAQDRNSTMKIGQTGVTFTIQKSDKKEHKDAIAITYPTTRLSFIDIWEPYDAKTADTLMLKYNNLLQNKIKYIKVIGIKDIDTMISVYNEYSIKAVSLFDNKKVYTYELAVPLKVLGLSIDEPIKFTYNIMLNGTTVPIPQTTDPNTIRMISNGNAITGAPTDFWGEYILAKK